MEVVEDLKKKVEHLEYEEIKEIKDKIGKIEINLNTNNILTKQSVETTNRLTETMDCVKETMIEMSQSIKQSNEVSKDLTKNVSELGEQVSRLDEKVNDIDNKSKFDIMKFLSGNWISIVGTATLIIYILFNKLPI